MEPLTVLRPLDAHAPYDVGPYRLLAGLGSGGMGTVHLALPPGGGPADLVALKTVRADLELEGDFRLRFRREAQAARAVRSPYVSALVAADPDAQRPWLATEYVVGPALDEAVTRAGALPVPVVRKLGVALARGLAAVHGARLVHRDLKPANVVLGAHGPRLIDFGIAQAYDATALTATGIMVGSPGFMSPEHVAGDRSVTAASDVFCLGAVLCFAATGQGPFQDSELAAVVHRIAQGNADLSRLPGELAEVVGACLHRDPARRPTTGELIRALDPAAGAPRPGASPPPPTGPFGWPDGVRTVIGEYELAVGRALIAPPPPSAPPTPAPPPSAPPETAPAAPGPRRSRRLRWALGIGAGLLTAALAAVLVPPLLPGAGDTGNGAGASPGAGAATGAAPGSASPRNTAPTEPDPAQPAAPVVTSAMTDFGPGARDRNRLPEGWSPWSSSFEDAGEPLECALGGKALVCRLYDEGRRLMWLEARDASDGSALWRYPAEGATTGNTPVSGLDLDPDGRHAYVSAADGEGFAVLDLDDGKQVAELPGRSGFLPTRARVHEGQVFTSYVERDGEGSSTRVLLRAHTVQDRDHEQQWEREIAGVFPQSLDIVGDRVWVDGPTGSHALDRRTGKSLAEVPDHCRLPARGAGHALCPDGVREAATLKKVSDARVGSPSAVSGDGLALNRGEGLREGSPYLEAVDLRTGRAKWWTPWTPGDPVLVAGETVLTLKGSGARLLALDTGKETRSLSYNGWPRGRTDTAERPTTVMLSGGALFATFADGTVLSAYAP
ncbi:protein kinase [Kitasatospora albolonga]